MGGILLRQSKILPKGLAFDRRWMLVDENHQFLSQREVPRLSLFKVEPDGNHFSVTYDSQKIELPSACESSEMQAVIWDNRVMVQEVSTRHSSWFSNKLGLSCKLVFFPEGNSRPVNPKYASQNEQVSLADGYPILLLGEASVSDLNRRLETPVPMNRFRPNLVFSGGEAFEEDRWVTCRIGGSVFSIVKPCARCVITTVDQSTGVKGKEPLATLAGYRTTDNEVYFAQNLIPIEGNEIRVGDPVIFEGVRVSKPFENG